MLLKFLVEFTVETEWWAQIFGPTLEPWSPQSRRRLQLVSGVTIRRRSKAMAHSNWKNNFVRNFSDTYKHIHSMIHVLKIGRAHV